MNPQNFNNTIESNLRILETERLAIISQIKSEAIKFIALLILIVLGFIFIFQEDFFLFGKAKNDVPLYAVLFLLVFLALAIGIFFYIKGKQKFESIYKETLVKPLMEKLYPELYYNPKSHVDEKHFKKSDLFLSGYTYYGGDDYFSGKIDGIEVEFSELDVIKSQSSENSGSGTKNTIFSGLFLHTKLEKRMNNRIIIDPVMLFIENMQLPGFVMSLIEMFLPNYGKVVKTGNNEFDKNFKLHCASEEEALKMINPEFINKILEIAEKLKILNTSKLKKNKDPMNILSKGVFLKLSIIEDSLYFAIFGNKLFDIQFRKSILQNKENVTNSLSNINILIDIAKTI